MSAPLGAVNALTHRLWWTLHREKLIETIVKREIGIVISRVPLPPIIKYLKIDEISFGCNVPFVNNASLTNFSSRGDLIVDCGIDYKGGAVVRLACCVSVPVPNVGKIVSSTISNVSSQIIGSSILANSSILNSSNASNAPRNITAALTIVVYVKKFAGQLRVMCLPPPSRTIWIGFHKEPEIEFAFDTILDSSASSLISSRLPMVTDAIASIVRTEIAEILVLPQMDNIEIPDLQKLAAAGDDDGADGTPALSSSSSSLSSLSSPKNAASSPSANISVGENVSSKDTPEIPVRKAVSSSVMQNMGGAPPPPRPPKASASTSSLPPPNSVESFDEMFPPVPRQRKPGNQQNVD